MHPDKTKGKIARDERDAKSLYNMLKKSQKNPTSMGKEIILKADKNLFSIMTTVAQSRQLDMKEILSHALEPTPWSL